MASKLDAQTTFIRQQLRRNASVRTIAARLAERGVKAGRNAVHHFITTRFGDVAMRRLLTGDLAEAKKQGRREIAAAVAKRELTARVADARHSILRGQRVVSFEFAGLQVAVDQAGR